MADQGGLSLLELVVTLSLASILAGISVLSHNALRPRLNLGMATRQVVMDLQVSRMRAVAQNAARRVQFLNGATRYQLQGRHGTKYEDEGTPVPLPVGVIVLDCTALASAIGFSPRGSAATFGTVTLQNSSGDTRSIVVDIAGHLRVQ